MPLHQLDVVVRAAGVTLLLMAMAGSRDRMAGHHIYFIPLAICLCGFLAGNSPDADLRLSGPLASLAMLVAGYAAVCLWWFCLAVFDAGFRPRGGVLAVGIAWITLASADRGLFGDALAEAGLSRALVPLGLVMVAHLSWRLLQDREGDLLERRRLRRRTAVIALAGQLFADLALDLLMGFDWQPPAFSIMQNAGLLAFTVWLVTLTPQASSAESAEAAAPQQDPDVPADPALIRLRWLMETERVHLDPELTFNQFVLAMGASERAVRRLINQELGYEHFRTFLNAHRVAEARRLLSDPGRQGDKLIAVAFASGFASLPTFNRVFRDHEGQTPSAFRVAAATGSRRRTEERGEAEIPAILARTVF